MAKAAWNRTIVDASGNVLPGADITVTDERTGTLATLFDDREGNDAKSNPFVADSNGFARFFADAGVYRVVAEAGALSRTWRYQSLLDNAVPITWTEDQIFTGDATVEGDFDIEGNFDVDGNANIDGDITVSGEFTVANFEATGVAEFTTLVNGDAINGKFVGELFALETFRAPSAEFPAVCLTDLDDDEAHTIDKANFPDVMTPTRTLDGLVTYLNGVQAVYLQGKTGETSDFPCSVSGSVITLTDTPANNAILFALDEQSLVFGGGLETPDYDNVVVTVGGETFPVTNINLINRQITVTGSPTGTTMQIFPHRVPGEADEARVFSMSRRVLTGAGGDDPDFVGVSGLMWRDQMQRITGEINGIGANIAPLHSATAPLTGAFSVLGSIGDTDNRPAIDADNRGRRVSFNSANSTAAGGARTGNRTKNAGLGTHIYIWGGRYVA